MEYKRYSLKPLYLRLYVFPMYLIPVIIPMINMQKPTILLLSGLSGILYLSTFWTLKSKLLQCYRLNRMGLFVEFKGEMCRISALKGDSQMKLDKDLPNNSKLDVESNISGKDNGNSIKNTLKCTEKSKKKEMKNSKTNSTLNKDSSTINNSSLKDTISKAGSKLNDHLIYDENQSALIFNNKDILSEYERVESFTHDYEKFLIIDGLIVRISPNLAYSLKEYSLGISHLNYSLFAENHFKVPNPSFITLFKEQCVSPLFCFQIFSSLLMLFDEYVLQSLFSTAMIIAVEAGMVFSRVSTMKMFRAMNQKSLSVKRVKKGGKSREIAFDKNCLDSVVESHQNSKFSDSSQMEDIDSTLIKPGDILLLDSCVEIPCDLLIISGKCAVSEAMLSGESVPLVKEKIPLINDHLDFKIHKKHILYAGTKVESVFEPVRCVALRTAFGTEQGSLLRQMLRSEDIKYDPEALRFILILTLIGIINSVYTYKYSKKTGYPLFIDIIVLFTNSIPFELPMEMGMSIQSAVKNLMMKKIYCLEPFRITLAGKVDVCCFDKTGTLTDSELELSKVVHDDMNTRKVLSCCNDLLVINGELRGDPLDLAIQEYLMKNQLEGNTKHEIVKKYPFTSELRRQAVIAKFNNDSPSKRGNKEISLFAVKGAPETIQEFLGIVPDEFKKYREYAAEGYRVVALAYREVGEVVSGHDQEYYEKDMVFAGFALFGCSLKSHAKEMVETLKTSNHRVVMITGDNLLTALSVAGQLGIDQNGVEGNKIDSVIESPKFFETSVFARADPKHKERIIRKYKENGFHTMMVGDGTNDVGALKAADVGVAMLSSKTIDNSKSSTQGSSTETRKFSSTAPVENSKSSTQGSSPETRKFSSELQSILNSTEESLKPGDASIAAPFTVKSDSLLSIIEIIQQGRSSLVTTIQMYKILALNSITSAFFLSLIDILGIKFSEVQMLSVGVLSALAFSAISNSKSLKALSKQRPQVTIFNWYFFCSILGQSLVHISTFIAINRIVQHPVHAIKFAPSVMNTALFVISSVQTVSCFISNYIGRPFREDLWENKILGVSLSLIVGFVVNIFIGFNQDLNDKLQVVDMGVHASKVAVIAVADTLLSYIVERVCFKLLLLERNK